MAEPGWPESRALPTILGVSKLLSAQGQMGNILGFVGQNVSVAMTQLSCYSDKAAPDICNQICEARFGNQEVGQICPTNHSLSLSILDDSTIGFLVVPDFDAAGVLTLSEKH